MTAPARAPPAFSIFTHSVGAHGAGHSLPSKLRAIAQAGFQGVEIFQDDLDAYCASQEFESVYKTLTPPASPQYEERVLEHRKDGRASSSSAAAAAGAAVYWNAHGVCSAEDVQRELVCASYVAGLCRSWNLLVYSLQPMRDVEGWRAPEKKEEAFARVRSRFPVLRALGTDLLLCCSNCQPADALHDEVSVFVDDFRALAREAACYGGGGGGDKPIRIAFEGLSWGTRIDTWAQAYDVVLRVNMPNFGLCLDSFNTLGREFADPCTPSGVQEPQAETHARVRASLDDLRTRVDVNKLFFLQLGDARKPLQGPLASSPNEHEARPARMIWSRANRLFPGEQDRGAYMPTVDFCKAALATGYAGPWSIEVFNASLSQEGEDVEQEHARRAFKGLEWLVEQVL